MKIRRRQKSHIEGHEEGWAVSYADLLMVLMSFFIIFFNQEDKVQSVIGDIVIGLGHDLTEGKQLSSENNYLLHNFNENTPRKPASNHLDLNITELKTSTGKGDQKGAHTNKVSDKVNGILVDLSDNIFAKGEFTINKNVTKELDYILQKLKPYKDKVNIVFIGHSDSTPMAEQRKIIRDNMILSSLRASSAVEYTINKGFAPYWVSAQGRAEYGRSTRSLSVRVIER